MTRLHEQADSITRDNARRTGRPVNLPAAFYAWTGAIPRNISPGNHERAGAVVRQLKFAKTMCHGSYALTRNEHTRLSRLITKWERRAQGGDKRFEVMGTKPGRPTKEEQARLDRAGYKSKYIPKVSRTVYTKRCIECGAAFQSHRRDKKYCSDGCRNANFCRNKYLQRGKV